MKKTLRAQDVMTAHLYTVMADTPIPDAIELLIEHRISGLPVVDAQQRLLGMLTEKDMLRVLYEEPGHVRTVSDLMTRELRTFQTDDPLEIVADCLMANHFRRVPVLSGDKLVGLISRADLMATILEEARERLRKS